MVILAITQYPIEKLFEGVFYNILPLKKYPMGSEFRKNKAKLLGERIYRLTIYSGFTVGLYVILKNSDMLNWRLLGLHNDPDYFHNYPCLVLPPGLDDFYVMKLSYHFYELVRFLALERNREDFPEFFLHHLVTFALIIFSYSCNYIPIGAPIMLLHDSSDLLVSVFKLCADTTHSIVEIMSFLIMYAYWIYTRLYVFPIYIIWPLHEQVYQRYIPNLNYSIMHMMFGFLCCLEGLHMFWTYLMTKGLYRKMFNKKKIEVIF